MTSSAPTDLTTIVLRFNDGINLRDIDGLASLMTDDHAFIDSAGTTTRGKDHVLAAWRGFFQSVPDYKNVFERVMAKGNVVTVVGRSTCSYAPLDGPALWVARIEDDKVAEWRVYEDGPETRTQLGVMD